jgi:zinc protease
VHDLAPVDAKAPAGAFFRYNLTLTNGFKYYEGQFGSLPPVVPRSEAGFAMRSVIPFRVAIVATLTVLLLAGCGQERTTTSVHTVTDNGAVIIARENNASQVVAAQVFVRDGALFETADEAGLAGLLRASMFEQTETRGPGDIVSEIEDLGGRMSSAGRHDFTQYAVTVPSDNFDEALGILGDGLLNARFDADRVERAREEAVVQISSSFSSSVDRAYRLALTEMMGDHPYGRMADGVTEVVSQLTAEDVERRYRERYVGSNLLVAVSGDIDAINASNMIADMLSGLDEGVRAEPVSEPVVWPEESRRVVERADVRRACQVVAFPGPGITDPENVTMDVLLVILTEGRSSRLHTRLHDELGLVHSVGAGWYTMHHHSPLFVWMELPDENVEAAEQATVELVLEMASEPVASEELAKAKMQLEVGNLRMVETAEGQAFHDGYWTAIGGEVFAREYVERLGQVTAEEIQRAAELYLGSGVHVAAVVLPE